MPAFNLPNDPAALERLLISNEPMPGGSVQHRVLARVGNELATQRRTTRTVWGAGILLLVLAAGNWTWLGARETRWQTQIPDQQAAVEANVAALKELLPGISDHEAAGYARRYAIGTRRGFY